MKLVERFDVREKNEMLSYILLVLWISIMSYELTKVCELINMIFSLFFPLFIFLLICCTDPRLTNQGVSNIFFD